MNRHILAAVVLLASSVCPALAASPEIEAAAKSLAEIETDAAKLQSYCKIIKDMDAAGDNEAKFDALETQLKDLLRSFGPRFEQVLTLSESTDTESPDGQALEQAFDKLDQKCAK